MSIGEPVSVIVNPPVGLMARVTSLSASLAAAV